MFGASWDCRWVGSTEFEESRGLFDWEWIDEVVVALGAVTESTKEKKK